MVLIQLETNKLKSGENPKNYPYAGALVALIKEHDPDVVFVGNEKLPFKDLENMVDCADMIVCIDSFLQHLAWIRGKYAYVIWGQSDPLLFGHSCHINLLKDRKYLRKYQYEIWETTPMNQTVYNADAFEAAEIVWKQIKDSELLLRAHSKSVV